tara:strand:+ start:206 stop:2431 length:2226 start_codon:yes stop_codon:yes gene_type:complete
MKNYLIIICLFLNFNLSAEIVQKLEVSGSQRISDETIKVYGDIALGKDFSTLDLNNVLKNLYQTDFFEDVKVSIKNGVLIISVKEYPIINSINLEGEKKTSIKSKILELLTLKEKNSFIESKISEDTITIKKIYESMGYNFVDVKPKVETFSNNRVNLVFFLEKGKRTAIKKINFTGDKKIKEKRLRDVIVSEEKKFWKFISKTTYLNFNNTELDKRLLINYYKSLGFYDVQVLSSNAEVSKENFTTLTYTINAGTRYRVNKISTNVSDVLDKKLFLPIKESYNRVLGKYYSPFSVKKILDDLDILIVNNDLQFIEHSINEILEGDTIEIKINIYEGQKQLVEKINILGNIVTDESVIRAELLLDEGDPFNILKFDQSIAKIKSRNLFGDVKTKIIEGSSPDQKIIEISVEEKPTGEISAGAGVGTNGGSFSFVVSENNWLGKGLNIATNIDIDKTSFSGGLSVTDPNYNYSGNSLSYYIQNTTNDKSGSGYKNNIVTTGIGTSFEQYRDIYIAPTLSFSYDDLKVKESASDSLKKQKGTFSDLSFNYAVTMDKRDRTYAPTDGFLSQFSQTFPIYADSPFIKNTYNFSKYKSFSPNAIGKFRFSTSAINGLSNQNVRLNKRVQIPDSKLRGFKAGNVGPKDGTDYVGGNYMMATNFEVSLPNFLPEATKTDVGLFIDFGNLWGVDYDKTLDDSNKIRSTTGINTSWSSPVGPMSFIFSKNIIKASTDVTESFNFRLGTTF